MRGHLMGGRLLCSVPADHYQHGGEEHEALAGRMREVKVLWSRSEELDCKWTHCPGLLARDEALDERKG